MPARLRCVNLIVFVRRMMLFRARTNHVSIGARGASGARFRRGFLAERRGRPEQRARAHCAIHGWGDWSSSLTISRTYATHGITTHKSCRETPCYWIMPELGHGLNQLNKERIWRYFLPIFLILLVASIIPCTIPQHMAHYRTEQLEYACMNKFRQTPASENARCLSFLVEHIARS